ncbi:methyl-accepting chemotaxis protein [Viridibacterium curvum]|uniref:Methyl-accepting chemotaxis protein n=1 Tax=Viridibacterium curvum TaxID=1101404 RepID=A0ABP9Q9N9_9RHOO
MDVLIAPLTRFMNKLGIERKLLATVVVMFAAAAAVSVLLVKRINNDVAFTAREELMTPVYRPARLLVQAMQEHRGVMQAVISGNTNMTSRLPDIESRARAASAEVSKAVLSLEGGTALTDWQRIAKTAEAVLSQRGATAADSFAAHTDLVGAAINFIVKVADETNATLDPEIVSYALMDTFVTSLPANAERMGRVRAKATLLATTKQAREADLSALRVNHEVALITQAQAKSMLAKAIAAAPSLNARFETVIQTYLSATKDFDEALKTQVLGERITAEPAEIFGKATKAIDAAYALADLAANEFDSQIETRLRYLKAERNLVFAVLGVSTLLALLCFIAVRRGVRRSVDVLTRACSRLASGEMDVDLRMESRDEFSAIARDVSEVVKALRTIVLQQKRICDEHESGNISYRIDPAGMLGAYAEMARGTNALAQGHIDTKMKFVEVLKQYADGNFAADMPELPGQKMVITNAARDIKRKLLGVSNEIGRLADAAARGDFSQRGDETAFANGYRDMVVSLNRLTQVASNGLTDVMRVVKAMAAGDLTQHIHADYEGMFAELKQDVNATVERLREVVQQIETATHAVNTAAQEIASGNADLSSRTEEQASSLEETAASMEELNSTVKQNAESAMRAEELTTASNDVAVKGGEMVQRVVETMSAIQASSQKMADIIGVIDSIAFQTNILALNAAVEAARAGDQGRGFAVVASEVRNLAQRSSQAAREIKTLIDNSVETVTTGSQLVAEAGDTMSSLVSSVQDVSGLVSEIAAASREQAEGIAQVSNAVTQMDEVTQQNAALVEQAAAAAESLEDQARQLNVAVAQFKLGNTTIRTGVVRESVKPAAAAVPKAVRADKPAVVAPDAARPAKLDRASKPRAAALSRPVGNGKAKASAAASGHDEWTEF